NYPKSLESSKHFNFGAYFSTHLNTEQLRKMKMLNNHIFIALIVFTLSIGFISSECCKRKDNFGCCGNGKCNIFCCNCDGGCNTQCERTHCDTADWFKCAGIVAECAQPCIDLNAAECVHCMGELYDICKKCYS
uniref:Uncharacterized protein n=1 Tax=Clytia hemisphaerica TaxID=252671 RepID=A0A7M5V7Z0_9CNID